MRYFQTKETHQIIFFLWPTFLNIIRGFWCAAAHQSNQIHKKISQKKWKKYYLIWQSLSKISHPGRSGPDKVRKIFAIIFESTFNWYPSNSNIWRKEEAKKILFTISGRIKSNAITNTIWDSNEVRSEVSKTAWTIITIIQSYIVSQKFFD